MDDLLKDLICIQDDLTDISKDNMAKKEGRYFQRALTRLYKVILTVEGLLSQEEKRMRSRVERPGTGWDSPWDTSYIADDKEVGHQDV